jgi:D-glycero-alpha-D-manno-heptose 1-phosphate guanylyltransferase
MRAILLAGGAGTRLREVVQDVPKPLAPVAGRPFLSYMLDLLEARGMTEIVISIGYLGHMIRDSYGARYGAMSIRYAVEEQPLGTGGGLRNALAQIDRFPVFALNADTLLDLDYRAMERGFARAERSLGLAVRSVDDTARYGRAVLRDDRVVAFEPAGRSGQGIINAGVYLFGRNLLDDCGLPERFSFEHDFLEPRAAQLQPFAFATSDYFIDIGVPSDYGRAQHELPKIFTGF